MEPHQQALHDKLEAAFCSATPGTARVEERYSEGNWHVVANEIDEVARVFERGDAESLAQAINAGQGRHVDCEKLLRMGIALPSTD